MADHTQRPRQGRAAPPHAAAAAAESRSRRRARPGASLSQRRSGGPDRTAPHRPGGREPGDPRHGGRYDRLHACLRSSHRGHVWAGVIGRRLPLANRRRGGSMRRHFLPSCRRGAGGGAEVRTGWSPGAGCAGRAFLSGGGSAPPARPPSLPPWALRSRSRRPAAPEERCGSAAGAPGPARPRRRPGAGLRLPAVLSDSPGGV